MKKEVPIYCNFNIRMLSLYPNGKEWQLVGYIPNEDIAKNFVDYFNPYLKSVDNLSVQDIEELLYYFTY